MTTQAQSLQQFGSTGLKSKLFIQCVFIFLMCYSVSLSAEVNSVSDQRKYKAQNTGFVKNVGQVYDYDKKQVSQVLYSLNADNSSIFLTTSGLTYSLIERDMSSLSNRFDDLKSVKPDNKCLDKNVARLDMELIDASIQMENITEQVLMNDVQLSYCGTGLSGSSTNMHYCRQLTVSNIYPQIDWVLKITNEGTFKYDFIVHAGADANLILIKYNGAKSLQLNKTKDEITAATALGKITEGKLYCYTQNDERVVAAEYNLQTDVVNFNLPSYNKRQTLVIDPAINMALTWSTYYGGGAIGGGGGTVCNSIKCDEPNNRVYIVGYCFSNPFPNYNNSVAYYFSPSQAGSTIEAFISAFDIAGVQKWATYYMSTEYDGAFDVAVDNSGNIYMAGTTESHNSSTIGFLTQQYGNGFIQSKNNAVASVYGVSDYQEGFIVKFNYAGQLKWATLFGGDHTDQIYSVNCDNNNNVFVAGLTWSQNLLPLKKQSANGFFQNITKAAQTGLIAEFNSNTELQWSTYFGSVSFSGTDCRTIACDLHNNIYVTGAIGSTYGFPFTNSPGAYYNTGNGYYMAAFDCTSKIKYCGSFQPGQHIIDLSLNPSDGSILIAGYTDSSSAISWTNTSNKTANTYFDDSYNGSDHDGFLILLNPDFSIEWSTIFGGNGNDQISAASIGNNGEILIAGYTDNTYNSALGDLPVVNAGGSAYFQDNLAAYDPAQIFIASFESESGADPFKLSWCTLFGDQHTGREFPYDLDVSGKNIFIAANACLEPQTPGFPMLSEPNGFLQPASNPVVNGFNPSGSNGLILKFVNENNSNLRTENISTQNKSSLKLYPNPCADKFISLQQNNDEYADSKIQIIDASGRCVKQFNQQIAPGENTRIDLDGVAKGYYFISVKSNSIDEKIPFVKF
ncbi:MAG: SBBP repeat-containing protein [Bacteroidia bacterium]